jgi:hypothetical protein
MLLRRVIAHLRSQSVLSVPLASEWKEQGLVGRKPGAQANAELEESQ